MNVINEIKTLLGMEVKLAQMNLEDGVTAKEFTEIFPVVRLEQVRAVLDFAAKNSLTFA